MPPPFDNRSSTKVIVSPPRINLRRAASYTHDKGPLSSTSSRFSFNHLLFSSPPPSPGLPRLIPRPRKPSNSPRPSRVLRVLLYVASIGFLLYLTIATLCQGSRTSLTTDADLFVWPKDNNADGDTYEMVSTNRLPDFPTPIMVSDGQGQARWTVSIPPNHNFPLAIDEYASICTKCREVASRTSLLSRSGYAQSLRRISSGFGNIGASIKSKLRQDQLYHQSKLSHAYDRNFVDVHEAEVSGFLPGSVSIATLMSQQAQDGSLVGEAKGSLEGRPVCGRTMTFVLESSDAGLGRTIMLLWMAYGLAQTEGRQFFIDDTRWAYGKYMGIFSAPPVPNCRPPLRHEMLPCPRQARHLVITVDTGREFFLQGHISAAKSKDKRAYLFSLARHGYNALFKLNQQDADNAARTVQQLRNKTVIYSDHDANKNGNHGSIVGVHVRRGDRRPMEFQYRDSYIPLNLYADQAHKALSSLNGRKNTPAGQLARSHSLMVVASDDPVVYAASEFAGAARAQEHIRLANGADTQKKPQGIDGAFRQFVDEAFGWEGGFFAAMFWNVGRPSQGTVAANAAANAASPSKKAGRTGHSHGSSGMGAASLLPPSAETLQVRSLVGRAYMLDLAVLAEASDTIVCAVSATGCRLLAVMMGWNTAIERGHWVNIDGGYDWWALDD